MNVNPLQGHKRGASTALSEINVTPLVDVMLVLLVIFMVTAPMMQQGVDVQLPQESASAFNKEEGVVISITDNERIYFNDRRVTLNELEQKIGEIISLQSDKEVFLKADKSVAYGVVVKVIAAIKRSGVKKLGMVTEAPPQKSK
ncbi:MAG: protein TolR [Candidatus Tectomicrobia bacterium]|uniref:Protein TolR n=1 Tax=Tectimicrobiota bacterium TaxID=2528274 RepID=A0A933LQH2_UNCTE|nr:protein TolR [Candidatus Tectomicrobia bacterium]